MWKKAIPLGFTLFLAACSVNGGGGDVTEDVCKGVTCGNGTCVEAAGAAVCECEAGHAGDSCDSCAEGWIVDPSNADDCVVPEGVLSIVIRGLPGDVDGRVIVDGPENFRSVLSQSAVIDGLVPGEYRISPLARTVEGGSYIGGAVQTVELVQNGAEVEVHYAFLETLIAPEVRTLGEFAPPIVHADITEEDAILEFAENSPEIEGLVPGDILALGVTDATPAGFLGRIVEKRDADGNVEIVAERVPLAEAVEQGTLSFETNITYDDIEEFEPFFEGVTLLSPSASPVPLLGAMTDGVDVEELDPSNLCISIQNLPLRSVPGISFKGDGDLTMSGKVCISPWIHYSITVTTIENIFNPNVLLSAGFGQSSHFVFEGDGKIDGFATFPIAAKSLPPMTFYIDRVPVIIQPRLTLTGHLGGGSDGKYRFEVKNVASAKAGLEFDNWEFHPFSDFTHHEEVTTAGALKTLWARGGAGPGLDLMFYGLAGPSVKIHPYLMFETTIGKDPWWTLYLGVETWGGLRLSLFDIKFLNHTFEGSLGNRKWPIAWAPEGFQGPIVVSLDKHEVNTKACEWTTFTATATGDKDKPPKFVWEVDGRRTFYETDNDTLTIQAPNTPGTNVVRARALNMRGQMDEAVFNVVQGGATVFFSVDGLPEGATPDVVVHNEKGEEVELGECTPTGTYTITAKEVFFDGQVWTPDLTGQVDDAAATAQKTITLEPGDTELVTVRYQNLKGWMYVDVYYQPPGGSVRPLSESHPVSIEVTGPFGFKRQLAGADTLHAVELGVYSVTASPTVIDGVLYYPVPASLSIHLEAPNNRHQDAEVVYVTDEPPPVTGLWAAANSEEKLLSFPNPDDVAASYVNKGLIPGSGPSDFRFDVDGNLWAIGGMDMNIRRYAREDLGKNPEPDLVIEQTNDSGYLHINEDGNLWVLRTYFQEEPAGRLFRFDADTLEQPDPEPSLELEIDGWNLRGMEVDHEGNFWIFSSNSLRRFDGEALREGSLEPTAFSSFPGNIYALTFGPDGSAWIAFGGAESTVRRLPPAAIASAEETGEYEWSVTIQMNPEDYEAANRTPSGLTFDPEGNLWIAHNGPGGGGSVGIHVLTPAEQNSSRHLPHGPKVTDYGRLSNIGAIRWLAE